VLPPPQGIEWFPADNGSPVLKDAISYIECTVVSRMETPDHWVTYATVSNGDVINADELTAVHHRKVGTYY
jgi:flavin reductase (DIM6/NTAB) family NADH-FMN oxidoreductase RutF